MNWKGNERRKFSRIKFPCKIYIYTPQEQIIFTHTENLSIGGVKIAIEEELKVDSLLEIEIYICEETIICRGEVAWVTKKESRYHNGMFYYEIGINFSGIKDKDKEIIRKLVESTD